MKSPMKYENMKNAIIAKTANIESYNESEMADLNTFLIIDIQNEIAVVKKAETSGTSLIRFGAFLSTSILMKENILSKKFGKEL